VTFRLNSLPCVEGVTGTLGSPLDSPSLISGEANTGLEASGAAIGWGSDLLRRSGDAVDGPRASDVSGRWIISSPCGVMGLDCVGTEGVDLSNSDVLSPVSIRTSERKT